MELIELFLVFIVIICASFSIYHSLRSRALRRQKKLREAHVYQAKMNITMGLALLSMGAIQLFIFENPTGWRIFVGIMFLIIGGINFILGIKNYRLHITHPEQEKTDHAEKHSEKKA